MKIAVVAANGRVAGKVITEALNRGFDVTAFGRKENNTDAKQYVQKDLFDITSEGLKGFDAVVDAFGAWTEDTLPQHSTSLKHLCDALSGTDTRLLIVGGAGSLYAAPDLQVVDTPDFPKAIYDGANAARHLLTALLPRRDVNWSFVSPPARLGADGGFSEDKTGKYRLGKDDLLMDGDIPAGISVADLAVAIADDAENKAHLFERFTVAVA